MKKTTIVLAVCLLAVVMFILLIVVFLPLPEKIKLEVTNDKTVVSRCLTLKGIQYLVRTNMPDAGSSFKDKNGNIICHQGGLDPTKSTGSCTMIKLCLPVVTK